MSQFEFEEISQYGIRKLRVIAAQIGVKAPTRLKKDDLLKEVRAVLNREKEPYFSTSQVGRPSKKSQMEKIDAFTSNKNIQKFYSDKVIMNDNEMFSIFDNGDQVVSDKIIGYYRPSDTMYSYIDKVSEVSITPYAIATSMARENKLKLGDRVEAKYYYNTRLQIYMTNEVLKINDIPLNEITKRKEFNEMKAIMPRQKVNFVTPYNRDIYVGTRNLIKVSKDRYETLKNNIDVFNGSDIFDRKVYLALNEVPEVIGLTDNESISFPKTKSFLDNLREFKLATSNVKREVENGKDVLFVILSLKNLESFLENSFANSGLSEEQQKIQSYTFIKELLNLSRDFKESGSLTIFVFDDTGRDKYDNQANNILTNEDIVK